MIASSIIQKIHESIINEAEKRCPWRITGVTKINSCRNEKKRTNLQQEPVLKRIENKQLNCYEDLMRLRILRKKIELGMERNRRKEKSRKYGWSREAREAREELKR